MDFHAIFNRAKNIIVNPLEEWHLIKDETSEKNELIRNYAIPLISLCAIASIIGNVIFSFHYGFSIAYVIITAIIVFIVAFFGMYISAIIINELAPGFNSKQDINSAFKLVIYSYTAFYIAYAIANLFPPLSFISILGLYGFYLLWTGATPILNTPEDKKAGFVIVSALIIIIVIIPILILGAVLTSLFIGTGIKSIF